MLSRTNHHTTTAFEVRVAANSDLSVFETVNHFHTASAAAAFAFGQNTCGAFDGLTFFVARIG